MVSEKHMNTIWQYIWNLDDMSKFLEKQLFAAEEEI